MRDIDTLSDKIDAIRDWKEVEKQRNDLASTLKDDLWQSNPERATELSRQISSLDSLLKPRLSFRAEARDLEEIWDLARGDKDAATMDSAVDDLAALYESAAAFYKCLLLPEPEHRFHAIVELNAGEGGIGATQFLWRLAEMYRIFSEGRGWTVSVVEESGLGVSISGEMAAKKMVLKIEGEGAFGWLQHEGGLHRQHRYSPHDRQQRRMSYIVAVKVLPLDPSEDGDGNGGNTTLPEIPASDLKIETMRSSGAGGQSVNRTESAVRITHIPTGIWVHAQVERSQHQNKALGMRWLRAKLLDRELQRREDEKRVARKLAPIASFGSQMVRTYSLNPTEMLKDWGTGYETKDVIGVLDGDLEELLETRLVHFLKEGGFERDKRMQTE